MLANPCGKLERLVSQLYTDGKYLAAIDQGLAKYKIKCYNIATMRPNHVLQAYYQISERFYTKKIFNSFQCWHQNQLKIYIWLLIGYSYLEKRCISEMNELDWSFFTEIFKHHNPILLQYQALHILKNSCKNVKWAEAEITLLETLINKNKKKNMWNDVARNLYVQSERKYFRTAKQCREYWINHLDPIPVKSSWSFTEDYNLIQWVYLHNKKWAKVSKMFQGKRTEHMVKNRFNSLYHFELKKYPPSAEKQTEQKTMMNLKQKLKFLIEQQEKLAHFVKTATNMDSMQQVQMKKSQQQSIMNQAQNQCQQSQFLKTRQNFLNTSNQTPLNFPSLPDNQSASEYHINQIPYEGRYQQIDYEGYSYFSYGNQMVFHQNDLLDKNQQYGEY